MHCKSNRFLIYFFACQTVPFIRVYIRCFRLRYIFMAEHQHWKLVKLLRSSIQFFWLHFIYISVVVCQSGKPKKKCCILNQSQQQQQTKQKRKIFDTRKKPLLSIETRNPSKHYKITCNFRSCRCFSAYSVCWCSLMRSIRFWVCAGYR